jgi:acyl-CoA synthetase (AMP-forming)/AMP-acid ligase II
MAAADVTTFLPAAPEDRDRIAVRRGDRRLSYGELDDLVEALANELVAWPEQTVVGIRMGNDPAYLVAVLGCFRAHRPALLIDVLWSDSELEHAAGCLGVGLLLQAQDTPGRSTAETIFSAPTCLLNDLGRVVSSMPARSRSAVAVSRAHRDLTDVALVLWSSGSTGLPKPISVPRSRLQHRMGSLLRVLALRSDDRTLCILPLSHCHGIECVALPTLVAHGELVLMDPLSAHPAAVAAAIEEHSISVFSALPRFYDQLVQLPEDPGALRSLRIPMCGSAALGPEVAQAFARRFGVKIGQGYGLTEIGVVCLNQHEHAPVRFDSVGRVLPGIEWRIHEPDPEGVGELWLRSRGRVVAWSEEAQQPTEGADDWMATGDLVRADADDYLYVVGRLSSFINVNGAKADPHEIERTIATLPWVAECAVGAQLDASGVERVIAYVVRRSDARVEHPAEEVQLWVAERLSIFKVPSSVVLLDALPRTTLGKVQYAHLPASEHSKPSQQAPLPTADAPCNETQRVVAGIWSDVLGHAVMNRTASFTSQGGSSVLLVQLLDRLRDRFRRELTIVDLFRYPTIERQAELLLDQKGDSLIDEAVLRARRQRDAMRRRQ